MFLCTQKRCFVALIVVARSRHSVYVLFLADLVTSLQLGANRGYRRDYEQWHSQRWQRVKQDPVRYARWKEQARASMRKSRMKKKIQSLGRNTMS